MSTSVSVDISVSVCLRWKFSLDDEVEPCLRRLDRSFSHQILNFFYHRALTFDQNLTDLYHKAGESTFGVLIWSVSVSEAGVGSPGHHFGDVRLFSAQKLTGLYRKSGLPPWEQVANPCATEPATVYAGSGWCSVSSLC